MGRARLAAALVVAGLLSGAVLGGGVARATAAAGLVVRPTQGPPNSTVSFVGSGFCAATSCGAVTIAFDNATVAYPVHVSADGSISGAFVVPSGPNGYQRVVATQLGANRSATALFFVGTALPGPTGPQPTVSYTPPQVSLPSVHGTQPLSPVTTPPTGASASSSTAAQVQPSGSPTGNLSPSIVVPNAKATSSSSSGWWLGLGLVAAAAVAAAGVILLRRFRSP